MPLTWAEAVTADKVEVKEAHIEELREGIDVTYDYAVDIDGRLYTLKGRVDNHIGSTGVANHGNATTSVSGFMSPTQVGQLEALAAYLNPDGTLNIKTEVTNVVNNPATSSSASTSGYFTVQCNWKGAPRDAPSPIRDIMTTYELAGFNSGWGGAGEGGWAELPVPNGFTKENCTYTLLVQHQPSFTVTDHDGGNQTDTYFPRYQIVDYNKLTWFWEASDRLDYANYMSFMYICNATR